MMLKSTHLATLAALILTHTNLTLACELDNKHNCITEINGATRVTFINNDDHIGCKLGSIARCLMLNELSVQKTIKTNVPPYTKTIHMCKHGDENSCSWAASNKKDEGLTLESMYLSGLGCTLGDNKSCILSSQTSLKLNWLDMATLYTEAICTKGLHIPCLRGATKLIKASRNQKTIIPAGILSRSAMEVDMMCEKKSSYACKHLGDFQSANRHRHEATKAYIKACKLGYNHNIKLCSQTTSQ